MVLVLDSYCTSIISNLFGMTELVGFGINVVEKLEIKRKKLPDIPVMYFIEPREASLKHVADDFSEDASYSRIHMLFPYKCSKENLNSLALNARIVKHIRSIKEFFHSCLFLGDNVLTLQQQYLEIAYSEYGSNRERNMRTRIAAKFVEIFRSLGSFYQVNLHYKKSTSGVA